MGKKGKKWTYAEKWNFVNRFENLCKNEAENEVKDLVEEDKILDDGDLLRLKAASVLNDFGQFTREMCLQMDRIETQLNEITRLLNKDIMKGEKGSL